MSNKRPSFLLLTLVVIGSGMLLTVTALLLQPRIEQQRQLRAEKIYFDVLSLPEDEQIKLDTVAISNNETLGLTAPTAIYLARRQGAIIGVVLPAVAQGYNGRIDLLVGIDQHSAITHVRAIAHHESRGIGDAIDISRSSWIDSFAHASSADPERVRLTVDGGDIDQITGATVTSRAVSNAVQSALIYFAAHRAELIREHAHE